ncbi:DivIVA domain-containing protein [Arthrobacter silviterrae]|uniref:DivIVA domain-containing protein n=2 Tax=Arthrobacter silviterrae TaxID=2026658 RepID=A0ABX0D7I7_9MICC|nr:DivIVA domain-containing protein [Arthrobacter silviterrae]
MLAAAVAMYVVGLKKPAGAVYDDGLAAPVDGLPPVLLPAGAVPADIDRLRFALGLRGYRMDQVDEVLDRLRDELAAKDSRIAELEAALAAGGPDDAAPSPDASGTQPDGEG